MECSTAALCDDASSKRCPLPAARPEGVGQSAASVDVNRGWHLSELNAGAASVDRLYCLHNFGQQQQPSGTYKPSSPSFGNAPPILS
eukprot:16150-Chlamydomonas_euryale.AAC.1